MFAIWLLTVSTNLALMLSARQDAFPAENPWLHTSASFRCSRLKVVYYEYCYVGQSSRQAVLGVGAYSLCKNLALQDSYCDLLMSRERSVMKIDGCRPTRCHVLLLMMVRSDALSTWKVVAWSSTMGIVKRRYSLQPILETVKTAYENARFPTEGGYNV